MEQLTAILDKDLIIQLQQEQLRQQARLINMLETMNAEQDKMIKLLEEIVRGALRRNYWLAFSRRCIELNILAAQRVIEVHDRRLVSTSVAIVRGGENRHDIS